jgi:TonB family protein
MEIFHSLFWINPLFFYLKKELVNTHEFEVDQEMYKTHKSDYMRHLLNYALGSVDSHYLLTSPFYSKLTLKKRIKAMKTSKKSNLLLLLTIPVFALLLSLISCETNSPETHTVPTPPPPPIPTEYIQKGTLTKKAQFPGGQQAMFTYMGENIHYSKAAQEQQLSGKVYISFTVKEDGKVSFVTVKRGVGKELDDEAIRVVKNMPNWVPAEIDGQPVASQMTLPIMFQLD